jgi:hypothetical protein
MPDDPNSDKKLVTIIGKIIKIHLQDIGRYIQIQQISLTARYVKILLVHLTNPVKTSIDIKIDSPYIKKASPKPQPK